MADQEILLEARNITKRFPGCVALDNVDFDIHGGEVHVIFGENGVGKTTLVKILTGVYPPDEGKVYIKNQQVKLPSSHYARSLGIGTVHQEFSLVPELSVMANLFLGREHSKGLLLDKHKMEKEAQSCLEKIKFGAEIRLHEKVANLSLTQKQMLNIARSLMQEVSVLILDEPTSDLSEEAKPILFDIINRLKADGKGIVYVSHTVDETEHIADRVTILRDGKRVSVLTKKEDVTDKNLVKSIIGVIFTWRAAPGLPVEYVSSNIDRQFGYRAEHFASNQKLYADIIHPSDIGRLTQEMKAHEEAGVDSFEQEYRITCADGRYKWVHGTMLAIRDPQGRVTHYRGDVFDITEAKRVEEALRRSEEKYASLIKNIPDAIYSALPRAGAPMVFISGRYQDWTGYSPDECYKDPEAWPKSIYHKDRARAVKEFSQAIKQKREYVSEYRVVHKYTEQVYHLRDHSRPVLDETGDIVRFDGIFTNITGRKEAERLLRESEEFSSGLLSNAPNPIVVINPDTSIRYVNPAFEKLTDFHSSEIINRKAPYPWWEEEIAKASDGDWQKVVHSESSNEERLFIRKNGEQFWVEIVRVSMRSGGEFKYTLESWNDVTEQKELRENLQYYASEVTKAQEEERERIALELHDETVQALFSLVTDIDEMVDSEKQLPSSHAQRLGQIKAETGRIMDKLRQFSHELRPGLLDHFGLVPSLELLAEEASKENKVSCQLSVIGSQRRLSPETELALFRVTQEALHNIKKHSKATNASIEVKFTDHRAQVHITDNGIGFKVPRLLGKLAREGKVGLIGMRERSRLIRGRLSVKSETKKGTTVTVDVPV